MLDSLLIRNFRLFKEFRIDRLGRVNLFVGKNNSGKSCLLEAIQVYAVSAVPFVLFDLVLIRDEDWESSAVQGKTQLISEFENPLRHLFYGFHFPEKENGRIEIGSATDEANRIHIYISPDQSIEGQKHPHISLQNGQSEDAQVILKVGWDNDSFSIHLSNEDAQFQRKKFSKFLYPSRVFKTYKLQTIPAQHLSSSASEKLWDNINLTDLEIEVISCLQMIEPKVKGIAFVGDKSSRNRIPIVRLKDSQERLPLKSLGDGMLRLFHISLALVNARDGFLLIDEFENGLHWKVHPTLWKMLFQMSEKLNVQVFATTHSRDCIRGFYEAWAEAADEDIATFHRLNRDLERGVRQTNYSRRTLSDALATEVEVR